MNSLKRAILSSALMLIALSPGVMVRAEPPPGEGGPPPGEGAAPPPNEAPKAEEKEQEKKEKAQRKEQPPEEKAPPQSAPPPQREERRDERRQERREERQEQPPVEQPKPQPQREERREAPRERIQEQVREPAGETPPKRDLETPREERRQDQQQREERRREQQREKVEEPKTDTPPKDEKPKEQTKEQPKEQPKTEREAPKETIAPGEPAPGSTPPAQENKGRETGPPPDGAPSNGASKPQSREDAPAQQQQTPPASQAPSSEPQQGAPKKSEGERSREERGNRDRSREGRGNGNGNGAPDQRQGGATPPPASTEPAGTGVEQPREEPKGQKLEPLPKDETQAREVLKKERARSDNEFEAARREAEQQQKQQPPEQRPVEGQRSGQGPNQAPSAAPPPPPRIDDKAITRFQDMRRQRRERVEKGGVAVIEEPGKRVIVRDANRSFIRHDEQDRLGRSLKEGRREKRSDGSSIIVNLGPNGLQIITVEDREGRVLRRSRRSQDGRETVLFDNRSFYNRMRDRPGPYANGFVNLPPPVVRIPRRKYVVDYETASYDDVYEALTAPPIERIRRSYSLEEVRQSYSLRQRMRRVDLDAITFAFASWEVDPEQYPKLERIAEAMNRVIDRNPDEVFMIEGHTDAVGSDIDNLSLSDRRAEEVAIILSDTFRVPPENLVTQGYGEQFLKVPTEGPSWQNRRVAVRRITPLLARQSRDPEPRDPYDDRGPDR